VISTKLSLPRGSIAEAAAAVIDAVDKLTAVPPSWKKFHETPWTMDDADRVRSAAKDVISACVPLRMRLLFPPGSVPTRASQTVADEAEMIVGPMASALRVRGHVVSEVGDRVVCASCHHEWFINAKRAAEAGKPVFGCKAAAWFAQEQAAERQRIVAALRARAAEIPVGGDLLAEFAAELEGDG
jgi:hypothetical protein